ncbi:MAG: bacterial Ig-like domain-containing protein [Ruminococcus sp.]|nr:bacterial Ig-like domain-containing protein [Ruminococcus sp.]
MTKKLISIATSVAMIFSGFGMATNPVNVNATADNGFTSEEISNSPLKPEITVDQVYLTWDEAQYYAETHTPIEISLTLSGGMDEKYSTTGMHVAFDNRLSYPVKRDGSPDVKIGEACELLDAISVGQYIREYGDICFSIVTSSSGNDGYDGVMYTLQFYLPEDMQPGDFYPVGIEYRDGDMFTDVADSNEAKLAQAYLFTQGINDGWIQIEGDYAETTTTAPKPTTITTTTTTTAEAPATTTTVVTYGINKIDVVIESVPTKTVYEIGEELDLSGGVYRFDWCFGSFFNIQHTAFRQTFQTCSMTSVGDYVTIDTSEFDNTRAGTYKIYVKGETNGWSDTESFEVEVLSPPVTTTTVTTEAPEVIYTTTAIADVEPGWLVGVNAKIVSLPKTTYYLGEKLDLKGGKYSCVALFENDFSSFSTVKSTYDMTSSNAKVDTSEFDSSKAGTYKIYVTASYGGFSATTPFEVEVLPQAMTTTTRYTTTTTTTTRTTTTTTTTAETSTYAVTAVDLSIESVPTKTVYNIGEKLDLTGGVYKYDELLDYYYMGYLYRVPYATRSMTETDSNVKIDTSEFDNTKAGTYKIYITVNLFSIYSDTEYFEVTVKNPLESDIGITLPFGDADCDGQVNINDCVLIMQSIANPDKYQLTNIGKMTADIVDKGDGITISDALAIQYIESRVLTTSDFPITSEELDRLGQ